MKAGLFRKLLYQWSSDHPRELPWIGEKDPYKIWISEIMLQQTRAETVVPFYLRFIGEFPNLSAVANASETKLMVYWQGLGYYSRLRNLHHAAQEIVARHKGEFPAHFEQIIALKGIGKSTASAIASFAYGNPYPVLDGNVVRVLARIFGLEHSFFTQSGKKRYEELAVEMLDRTNAGHYNQAIMNFGALCCTPKSPECSPCTFRKKCVAFQENLVLDLPVKKPKLDKRRRYFHYFVVNDSKGRLVLHQRQDNDIWKNLFEFFGIESQSISFSKIDLRSQFLLAGFELDEVRKWQKLSAVKQALTHQIVEITFWTSEVHVKQIKHVPHYLLVDRKKLDNFAFSQKTSNFIKQFII